MHTLGRIALSVLIALSLPACNTAQKYAKNNAAGSQWLSAHAGAAAINVSGRWNAPEWGDTYFVQQGDRVTGHLGKYLVRGVISGRTLYLLAIQDGWVYYSVVAEKVDRSAFEGYYSDSVPFTEKGKTPIAIVRAVQ